ncbi:MAG: AtpF2 [uncultured bacterium]|nr:MAG: AtpF2 [uncultured bacterium]
MLSKFITLLFVFMSQAHWVLAAGGESHEVHGNAHPDIYLLFKVVNFAILIAGLVYLLKKPVRDFFASRALSIRQGVEKSREFHEKVLAESRQINEKLNGLDKECASILASVKLSGEEESRKIEEQSKAFAQKIHT